MNGDVVRGLAVVLSVGMLLDANLASAQEPPPAPPAPPPVESQPAPPPPLPLPPLSPSSAGPKLERLQTMLDWSAEEARGSRHAFFVITLITGVASVPAGIVVWTRPDPTSRTIGSGLAIGGAAPLVLSLFALAPSSIETLDTEFRSRRAANEDPAKVLSTTEAAWAALAKKAEGRRFLTAVVSTVLGISAAGVGNVFLISKGPIAELSRQDQNTVGAILLGSAVPILAVGVKAFFVATPEESGWATYQRLGTTPTAMKLDVTPTFGGAMTHASVAF